MTTEMNSRLELNFHGKRFSDFDLTPIAKAQGFEAPVTAYLCNTFIEGRAGVGVVFGHISNRLDWPFEGRCLIRNSDVDQVSLLRRSPHIDSFQYL